MAIQFIRLGSVRIDRFAVKPESKSVKPAAKQWRDRDPEAYRAYMRNYMRKRRANVSSD